MIMMRCLSHLKMNGSALSWQPKISFTGNRIFISFETACGDKFVPNQRPRSTEMASLSLLDIVLGAKAVLTTRVCLSFWALCISSKCRLELEFFWSFRRVCYQKWMRCRSMKLVHKWCYYWDLIPARSFSSLSRSKNPWSLFMSTTSDWVRPMQHSHTTWSPSRLHFARTSLRRLWNFFPFSVTGGDLIALRAFSWFFFFSSADCLCAGRLESSPTLLHY